MGFSGPAQILLISYPSDRSNPSNVPQTFAYDASLLCNVTDDSEDLKNGIFDARADKAGLKSRTGLSASAVSQKDSLANSRERLKQALADKRAAEAFIDGLEDSSSKVQQIAALPGPVKRPTKGKVRLSEAERLKVLWAGDR